MRRKIIRAPLVPTPLGGYSPVVAIESAERLTFVGGIVADARVDGKPSSVEEQARQVVDRLRTTLDACGLRADNLVRMTVYAVDLGVVAVLDEALSRIVAERPPARTVIEVTRVPGDGLFALDAIAAS
jgi:2-iminobutanoate/2-iminopropanoate deaminase